MSLRSKKDRLALTLKIIFKNNQIIKTCFQRSLINVTTNMTYSKANNLITSSTGNEDIKRMYHLSKLLPINIQMTGYDSHKMVEKCMIYTNNLSAKFLLSNKNTVLRIHDEPEYNIDYKKINLNISTLIIPNHEYRM